MAQLCVKKLTWKPSTSLVINQLLSNWKAWWETGIITRNHQEVFLKRSSNPTCGCLESTTKSQTFDVEMTSLFNPQNQKQHPLEEITSGEGLPNGPNASSRKKKASKFVVFLTVSKSPAGFRFPNDVTQLFTLQVFSRISVVDDWILRQGQTNMCKNDDFTWFHTH